MASEERETPSIRGPIVGLVIILLALANPFDQFFCSSGCGVVDPGFSNWLSAHAGHWAIRGLMILVGVTAIAKWVKAISDMEAERDKKEKDAI